MNQSGPSRALKGVGREPQKGSGSTVAEEGLKAASSLCEPCHIKAWPSIPRLGSLSRRCISETSRVCPGRSQAHRLSGEAGRACGKRRGRPSFPHAGPQFLASLGCQPGSQTTHGVHPRTTHTHYNRHYHCVRFGTTDSTNLGLLKENKTFFVDGKTF